MPESAFRYAGSGGDQRLAFTGFHFGDLAAVQHNAADHLNVEMPHVEDTAAGFAHYRESFGKNVVERGAPGKLFFKINGFCGEIDIGELLDRGFEIIDFRDQGPQRFNLALITRAEYLGQCFIKNLKRHKDRCIYYSFQRSAISCQLSAFGRLCYGLLESGIQERMKDFRELIVWQKAHELTLAIYRVTARFRVTRRMV